MQKIQREPIAIIGIGCRFPGAETPQAFWQLLRQGEGAIREIPAQRWHADTFYSPDPTQPGKMVCKWGGFLDDIDQFDCRMFHIPPREARYMDPQHRLLLEVAWEALEDAGIPLAEVAGTQTGVAVGIQWNDYLRLQGRDWSRLGGYTALGTPLAFAANRLSYFFDLRGPSISVDTACASSLAALHQACQSLWMGETTLALAGGVNLHLSPDSLIIPSQTGLMSPTGQCRTLDASADGFVPGEGAGVVVLKPLSLVQPSDRVYALLRGVVVNHNGHNEWIMATSQEAQESLLRQAYSQAGVNPARVDYIELHGTSFLKGDAVEARAIGNVVGRQAERQHACRVGSVKTNIGHLGAASGIASLIKVALSLYHRELTPTLHLENINPDIPLEELQLAPQTACTPWPAKAEGGFLAGVSVQALTGTNAHAVLGSYDVPAARTEATPEPEQFRLLPISAASPPALLAQASAFKQMLMTTTGSWQNICYTAGARRTQHQYRLVVLAASAQEAAQLLNEALSAESLALPERVLLQENATPPEEALLTLGQRYLAGQTIDWSMLSSEDSQCVSLPTYPWQRRRLWLDWLNVEEMNTPPEHKIRDGQEAASAREPQNLKLLQALEAMSTEQWPQFLREHLRNELSHVLEIDPAGVQDTQSFFSLGMDSLTATQLSNRLQKYLEMQLPATVIFQHPSIAQLTDYLVHALLPQRQQRNGPGSSLAARSLVALEALSELEVEALLTSKVTLIEEILSEQSYKL